MKLNLAIVLAALSVCGTAFAEGTPPEQAPLAEIQQADYDIYSIRLERDGSISVIMRQCSNPNERYWDQMNQPGKKFQAPSTGLAEYVALMAGGLHRTKITQRKKSFIFACKLMLPLPQLYVWDRATEKSVLAFQEHQCVADYTAPVDERVFGEVEGLRAALYSTAQMLLNSQSAKGYEVPNCATISH